MSSIFNTKVSRTVFGICILSVSVLCTVLRIISTLFFFDSDIGYYQAGKILPILSYAVPIVAVVATIAFCFIPKIRITAIDACDTLYTRVCAILPALGFAAFSVIYILSLVEYSDSQMQIPFSFILCAICSVVSFVFFVLKFLGKQANIAIVICGILTVLWLVLALAQSYFDVFVTMNSPLKTVFHFACLAAMLLILCELRIGIDKTRTKLHLFASSAAIILLPLSAIPSLIGVILDIMPMSYTLVYYDVTLLTVSAFAAARFVNLCFGKNVEILITDNEDISTQESQTDDE